MILSFTQTIADEPNYFLDKIWLGLINLKLVKVSDLTYFVTGHYDKFGRNWDGTLKASAKITTIREDPHDRWKAGQLIHFSINPRSKNYFRFAPLVPCISVQSIEIRWIKATMPWIFVDGLPLSDEQATQLAINDGFESLLKFGQYFNKNFKGKIIHWTDLTYVGKKSYYILSGRHTHKKDEWLTFWRPGEKGYAWYKSWTGQYDKPDSFEKERSHGSIYVEQQIADRLWEKVRYDGKEVEVIRNIEENRILLGVTLPELTEYNPTPIFDAVYL